MKNINANPTVWLFDLHERDYTPVEVDGIQCLSDSQWEVEFAKLSVEQQALVKPPTTTTDDKVVIKATGKAEE